MSIKTLDVPYRSQWADDAVSHNADCGPTCVSMILNYYGVDVTPDQGYQILAHQFNRHFGPEQYTRSDDLKNLLSVSGVSTSWTSLPNKIDAIRVLKHHINNGRPFIALVNYIPFQQWTGNLFSGSHFVVVYGYDSEHVYMHDPLFNTDEVEKGGNFKLTYDQFAAGWGGFNNPNINPDWHLIYPLQAPRAEEEIKPPTQPITPAPKPPAENVIPSPITDEMEKRMNALAAWHGRTVNWDDGKEVQTWFDHIGSFGQEFARHQVMLGQTLSAISAQYYSRQDKWKAIKAYNRLAVDWANAGQWLRVPLFGNGSAHLTEPAGLPPKLEAFAFEEEPIEAPAYKVLAPHSAGMGMLESDGGQHDDSEAAGFSSNPDVTAGPLAAGTKFNAIWTFRNSGSTIWDSSYKIVHVPLSSDRTGGIPTAQLAAEASYSIEEVANTDLVLPGETVVITIPMTAQNIDGVIASHWQLQNTAGENFGKLRWISANFTSGPEIPTITPPDPVEKPKEKEKNHHAFLPIMIHPAKAKVTYGMNINPNLDSGDSREIDSRDIDINNQKGLGWIRYAYWASRNRRSGKEAYIKRYRQIIKSYADAGVKTLIVLHQDAYWGRGPWDHGGWGAYAAEFARECAAVARACDEFKDMVAYQIFNETDSEWGDDAGNHNPSAIGIPPEKYAIILQSAAKAIRAVDPKATIVASGMKTGPLNAVNYLKKVQQTLKKPLPVDALAYHPYGRHAKSLFDFVPFGSLSDAFGFFERSFPDLPVWLTEIGVPGHQHVFPPDRYPDISKFMHETVDLLAAEHAKQVPVVIWFAWSDFSENSGIKTKNGHFKDGIKEAYDRMRNIS